MQWLFMHACMHLCMRFVCICMWIVIVFCAMLLFIDGDDYERASAASEVVFSIHITEKSQYEPPGPARSGL